MKSLIVLLSFVFSFTTHADEADISSTILKEFHYMHIEVSNLEPDYMVGGLLNAKRYGDYELLWKLDEDKFYGDVIRIYRSADKWQDGFDVSYRRRTHLVDGAYVVRRTIGTFNGWRNHTVDVNDETYYGSQGSSQPKLTPRDREILNEWNITLF